VPNDFGLRLDDPGSPAIALRKQPAEFIDDVVGIEADGLRVIADERPRENP
jgi:hypothetical protein